MAVSPYVGRLAPSPTGLLHLGHARTFSIAYERAQAAGGKLWLRDEDLDPQRSKPEFAAAMREDLRWLGITWAAEMRQSERIPLYAEAMRELISAGYVYPCTCSRRDLMQATQAPHEDAEDEPVYRGTCRPEKREDGATRPNGEDLSAWPSSKSCEEIQGSLHSALTRSGRDDKFLGEARSGRDGSFFVAEKLTGSNYRFRVPDDEAVAFVDENAGPQSFRAGCDAAADFGDFLVWRKDGLPSYQLACVVDDAAMGITEIVRGRDLLKSTARQILLQRSLGFATPEYFHCDLVRDDAGVRLAKRHDALSLRALRESGATAEQVRAMFLR